MESWYDRALCVDAEVDFFSEDPLEMQMAKSICHECPVRRQCLQTALDNEERFGVWGGAESVDLRLALSTDIFGKPVRRKKKMFCPNCMSSDIFVGQTTKTRVRHTCNSCNLSWSSRRVSKMISVDASEEDLQ